MSLKPEGTCVNISLCMCVCVCVCVSLTSLCDASALPPHTRVSKEPPLPLHPHLALQVMLLWDLQRGG